MTSDSKEIILSHNTSKALSEHKQLDAIWNALNLVVHTEIVCANKKIFSLKTKEDVNIKQDDKEDYIVTKIHEAALNTYLCARRANRIRVTKDDSNSKTYRLDLILESVLSCDELLDLITVARPLYHLKTKKYEHWIKMVVTTKTQLSAWYRSEKNRYH